MDFASLRAKAQSAADKAYTVGKAQASNISHKYGPGASSASSSSSRPAYTPPAAPARTSASPAPTPAPRQPPVAPVRRETPSAAVSSSTSGFSWSTISEDDKQAFFALLDEYFASRDNGVAPGSQSLDSYSGEAPKQPKPVAWARPGSQSNTSSTIQDTLTSYPPPTRTGSSASDFCQLFQPSSPDWSLWYTETNPKPPTLEGRSDVAYSATFMQAGHDKTVQGACLFSDLSMAVYQVTFNAYSPSKAERRAMFSPRPSSMNESNLYHAYETYSEIIAQFAEQAVATRQPAGRGECWDLAHEALKSCEQYDVPAPVPSISRTHGHLIFEAKAGTRGRWRGGDTAIRRGDICEFKTVSISEVGAPRGSWSTLGDPEHTAIVVDTSECTEQLHDGAMVLPASFGSIEVIEQSMGQVPTRRRYDLSTWTEGQMWVYRPVGMEQYVGQLLSPEWPPASQRMQFA